MFKVLANIFKQLQDDWLVRKSDNERRVMVEFATIGRKMTLLGSILAHASIIFIFYPDIFFNTTQGLSNLTDISGRSMPQQFLYASAYSAPHHYYYYLILGIQLMSNVLMTFAFVSSDLVFAVVVLHLCGQLKILANRIQHMVVKNRSENYKMNVKIHVKHHCRLIGYYNLLLFFFFNYFDWLNILLLIVCNRFARMIDQFFSQILFAHFGCITMLLCIIELQLASVSYE